MARWDKEDTSSIPDWFWEAVDTPVESRTIEVDECDVAYRFYAAPGKPGMLLIHGMNAHSRWWDLLPRNSPISIKLPPWTSPAWGTRITAMSIPARPMRKKS